jgi:hypothetical protein
MFFSNNTQFFTTDICHFCNINDDMNELSQFVELIKYPKPSKIYKVQYIILYDPVQSKEVEFV